ncbi:metallophosphoesterase family protein [Listeria sp. PSOL-1]|uniref:metallophosphoesterase family protein n=1 Tax=Listeria sp. PSOL-1 TaxID=1844999 RepID=UPI0013D53C59|nr:metallophosphoesterase family protein [Listeria sp. PSOL-1]
MKPIFAIGDVHGEITLLDRILENWQKEKQTLLLVGDLIDRGENPGAVLKRIKKLSEEAEVIVLKGNHEQMLLDWLAAPTEKMAYYISQGGMETIQTLLTHTIEEKVTPDELAERVKEDAQDLIQFVQKLPLYYEVGKYVFVHAGVDLTLSDWHDTNPKDFLWIREPFLFGQNKTGKVFIFGHTPVQNLHNDNHIWISEDQTRLDIDGGAVFGGSLNAVVVEEKMITDSFSITK